MIVSVEELASLRSGNASKKIVLACGSFDILHAGHIDYLEWAHSKGDILVVATPCNHAIQTEKSADRPINDESQRMNVLNALRTVDFTVATSQYYGVMQEAGAQLKPDVFVVYKDWRPKNVAKLAHDFPDAQVVVCTQDKINSTTLILLLSKLT